MFNINILITIKYMFILNVLLKCNSLKNKQPLNFIKYNKKYDQIYQIDSKRIVRSFASSNSDDNVKIIERKDGKRPKYLDTDDILITGLNKDQDISMKVLNCKDVLQEAINRSNLSDDSAKALGEVMVCGLMMGSGLKGDETLQISFVGTEGVGSVVIVTDGTLKTKGMVGNPNFQLNTKENKSILRVSELFGSGQIQVVRNHPFWKQPMNGIIELIDTTIPLNMAIYMAQSEQRSAVLISDIVIESGICKHALGLMAETLPGALESNVETSIRNVQKIQEKGLSSYLNINLESTTLSNGIIPTTQEDLSITRLEDKLQLVLDDGLAYLGDGIRYAKTPEFHCQCSVDRVWRAIRLLPQSDITDIISKGIDVETKCGFCGKTYSVTVDDIKTNFTNNDNK
mmetsp:Transcript_24305/g.22092  ORF Transcript_24305/g.22092 Transcript_24305/m.22092 type:complete len:400 (+) Transcript_24305:3-1202(+)